MVVCQDYRRGVVIQCHLENLLGIDHRAGHATPADVQLPDDFVGTIQQNYEESLSASGYQNG